VRELVLNNARRYQNGRRLFENMINEVRR
jgi:hypothetical protein